MAAGEHLWVRRRGYSHHGVDIGAGEVIHFTGEPGSKAGALITISTFKEFACGGQVHTRRYHQPLSSEVVVERARSKLGESGYHLFRNNCEHFARWCVTGKHSSSQVNGAAASGGAVTVSGAAAVGGIGVVAAAGTPGLSAAGIMSGLAAIGPAGVMGGLVTIGALPGAASAGIVQVALKDDEALAPGERTARRVGRRASVAGAAATTVGGVAAVSAAGTAGLSAAGIASGLAALGGSMAVGTSIVVAAPAVVAAGVGFGSYRLGRRIALRRNRDTAGVDNTTATTSDDPHEGLEPEELRSMDVDPEIEEWLDLLVNGPSEALDDLATSTGDRAGVFTIWYRDELVHYGRATDTTETKPSNYRQADGVRGRIKGLTRQPGSKIQQRLQQHFPEDWESSAEPRDQKRASELLRRQGRCRVVRFDAGPEAREALRGLGPHLDELLIDPE